MPTSADGPDVTTVIRTAIDHLGPGWSAFPHPFTPLRGTLRSNRGHCAEIELRPGSGEFVITGHMPYGPSTRLTLCPQDTTAAACGRALADVLTDAIIPQYDAKDPALRAIRSLIRARLGRAVTIQWHDGTAIITWQLDTSGFVQARCTTGPSGYASTTTVTFAHLTPDQAVTILAAADTGEPTSDAPVHGSVARRLKDAAPGLNPTSSCSYDARGEHTTTLATADLRTRVLLHRPHQRDAHARITLEGRGNALAAVLATS